jgi:hypothetical protein
LTIGAAAIAGTGKIIGGINANNQGKYTAQVARRNADMDRRAAADAITRGDTEEARRQRQTGQLLGQQRAALAANGVDADFGSASDIQNDARSIGAEDALTIRQNALREGQGYEISAWNNESRARSARAQGKGALIGSFFDAGSTALSAASQVGQMKAGRAGAG